MDSKGIKDMNTEQARAMFQKEYGIKMPEMKPSIAQVSDEDLENNLDESFNMIDQAIANDESITDAIKQHITNTEWFRSASNDQKSYVGALIEKYYGDNLGQNIKPTSISNESFESSKRVVDAYYRLKDGDRSARIDLDNILAENPNLSYIYRNIPKITRQLEDLGLLTKTKGCP